MTELKFQFPADHPCGAGHFPGNPIIPGALLLDEVLACIAADLSIRDAVWQVKSAKFPQPARPGDVVLATYSLKPGGEIRFECAVSGKKVLSGIARNQAVQG
jgi:3-hydroxymyristoyl/3-hydroxydecanoyl-(acyl carrier protein) dehydratase